MCVGWGGLSSLDMGEMLCLRQKKRQPGEKVGWECEANVQDFIKPPIHLPKHGSVAKERQWLGIFKSISRDDWKGGRLDS